MSRSFDMDPCDCCKGDEELCCFVCFCPCLAYREAADNITPPGQKSNGLIYCLGCFGGSLCFHGGASFLARCLVLTALTEEVAKKRGIDVGGPVGSAVRAFVDPCICHSCTVVHESRLYKQDKERKDGYEGYSRFEGPQHSTNGSWNQSMDRGSPNTWEP